MGEHYGRVYSTYWLESKRQHWSRDARSLGTYILSNAHRNTEGLYHLPIAYAAHDLGWQPEEVGSALDELIAVDFVRYDKATEVVFVCNALKFQPPRGSTTVPGAVRALRKVPTNGLRGAFLRSAMTHAPDLAEALKGDRWGIDDPSIGGDEACYPPSISPAPAQAPAQDSIVDPSRLDDAREERERERRARAERRARERQQVYDTWVEVTGRDAARTRFSPERRRLIDRALDNYPFEDVLAAVKGWRNIPHNRGENATGTVYDELRLLLRDAEHIEKYRDAELGARRMRASVSRRYLTATELKEIADREREAAA